MADGHAQEFAPFVRHLQEPACPAPRIAGDLGIGRVADDRQCLFAGGGAVGQLDAFVVLRVRAGDATVPFAILTDE